MGQGRIISLLGICSESSGNALRRVEKNSNFFEGISVGGKVKNRYWDTMGFTPEHHKLVQINLDVYEIWVKSTFLGTFSWENCLI